MTTLEIAGAPTGRVDRSAKLSLRLRAETAAAHEAVEAATGLPGSVTSLDAYRRCLLGFARVVLPLEAALAGAGLDAHGIDMGERARSGDLLADLAALGVDPASIASAAPPRLAGPAEALGALYVVEGSVLGGRIIRDALVARFGERIEGASAYFGGRGARTGALWVSFRAALDRFGAERPEAQDDVILAANLTFDAFTAAFRASPIAGEPQ